uniref:Uncharacterized protein n=1 Tax=Pseudomonas phage PACT201 TaxID=3230130 RepID=A0AAU8GSC4_9VIRU
MAEPAKTDRNPVRAEALRLPAGDARRTGKRARRHGGEHMKRLSDRIEDVALAVEQERESSAKSMESYRQLKAAAEEPARGGRVTWIS